MHNPTKPQKLILIEALGGTISMVERQHGLVPSMRGEKLLESVAPYLGNEIKTSVYSHDPIASPNITFALIRDLAARLAVDLRDPGTCGAVVIQGTDTIEETSFLLNLLLSTDKPVVVTGAMRGANAISADGPANIVAAIRTAADPASKNRGVLVVMNNEIHSATRVVKASTSQLDAFCSPNGGLLGILSEGDVSYFNMESSRSTIALSPAADREPAIALLKIGISDNGKILQALPSLGFEGAVIEGMGAGHVPAGLVPIIAELCTAMPIVLASRNGAGFVHRRTYNYPGSETDLISHGVIGSGSLNALKARMLLMAALASNHDRETIAAAFGVFQAR
jgi:L-asparaginase